MSVYDAPVEIGETVQDDSPDAIDKETQQRYRIWKKNTPYLYDYVSTNSLLWPSLTVQFFPDLEQVAGAEKEPQLACQRMLLGTFTLGQAVDTISIYQLPYYRDLNKSINMELWNYSTEKEEFELSAVPKTKLRALQTITHLGDVNKLRYMPQNPDVIASANNYGDLVVYNRTKHSSIRKVGDEAEINEPQLRLVNNESPTSKDVFALDWNRQREGMLVSGSVDGQINVHDIKTGNGTRIGPSRFYGNPVGINDVEWIPNHDAVFATADDSGKIQIFDTRTQESAWTQTTGDTANSVCVNPTNTFCLATGHSNGSVGVWDIRGKESVYSFTPHEDAITQLKWHPKFHSVLGSSSADKLVKLHDLNKFDTECGLLFSHGGHMLGVNDFDWSLHEDWMVSSVADDNSLHVWKPASHVLPRY